MTHLTRRSLVSAAPAAVVAAAVPALASSSPDAALLALLEPYKRTLVDMDIAGKPHTEAENACFAMKKAHPDRDRKEVEEACGLDAAEQAWEEAIDKNSEVIRKISEQPAHTIEGLAFKARVSEREDNMDRDLVDSIVADLIALGGAHA